MTDASTYRPPAPDAAPPSPDFADALDALVHEADEARALRRRRQRSALLAREAAHVHFVSAASAIMRDVLAPRARALAARFPWATLDEQVTNGGMRLRVHFVRTERYPVTAEVDLRVLHDPGMAEARLVITTELVPQLVEHARSVHRDWPVDHPDTTELATFADAVLLDFVRLYLSIETDERYQRLHTHIDPVCGGAVTEGDAVATRTVGTRTLRFCSTACAVLFDARPDFYLAR
ncbi:MAG: hypothetical protein MUF21_09445 [Gemmatimonadaceae bacterium]|nr:hypothetical protein [Gemmatimonadaceae bacterium]